MAAEYSIRPGDDGPSLFKGESRVGSVIRWHLDSTGLSLIAGEITNLVYLNDANCDLHEAMLVLETSPSTPKQ